MAMERGQVSVMKGKATMGDATSDRLGGRPLGIVQNMMGAATGRMWRLPPRRKRVRVERNIGVQMSDGVTLATDHYIPVVDEPVPTILVRCPTVEDSRTRC